jgi:TPR repeat protein
MKIISRLLTVFLMVGLISVCLTQGVRAGSSDEEIADLMSKAEQGDAIAQHNLGFMYFEGKGIPQDFDKAAYWFTKAAEQGSWVAQYNLGFLYSKSQDYVRAYAWYNLAASQDKDRAKAAKETLLEKMSPNQIEEGQKLFKKLYDKIHNQAN